MFGSRRGHVDDDDDNNNSETHKTLSQVRREDSRKPNPFKSLEDT